MEMVGDHTERQNLDTTPGLNQLSPQFSTAHGCGRASTRIYGVALGQRARRTVRHHWTETDGSGIPVQIRPAPGGS